MSKRGSYVEYASKTEFKKQIVLSGNDLALSVCDELSRIGTRRILFICNKNIKKYKFYEEMNQRFIEMGIRLFSYEKESGLLKQSDIEKAHQTFKEYNCDTLITIGGTSDIDCGKMVVAMANTASAKNLSDITGDGNVKDGKYKLCCIATDAGASCATPFAEYISEPAGKWEMCRSSKIIPDITVMDTQLSMRTELDAAVDSALTAFCEAIEAFVSPVSLDYPVYRANAATACGIIYANLSNIRKNPEDSYLRFKTAVGGFYAGLSVRMVGIGYTHIVVHRLIERYGDVHGATYLKLLRYLLDAEKQTCLTALAELARYLNICTQNADDSMAAQNMIDSLDYICSKNAEYIKLPTMTEKEALMIADEVRHEASNYDLYKVDSKAFANMLMAVCAS